MAPRKSHLLWCAPQPDAAGVLGQRDAGLLRAHAADFAVMPHVLIVHEVADYPTWKAVFDDAAEMRQAAGERNYQVLRDEADANLVVHFSEWTTLSAARDFFESPRLVEIREQAGVKAPEFHYLVELEAGRLGSGEAVGS